jgi:hypothetical protein
MNFNFSSDNSHDSEYELFRDTTAELINLYGVPITYLITEKINQDSIFGESSHIKIDNEAAHKLFAMPNATDMWEGDSNLFSKFGLQNLDSISLFIAREEMEKLHPELVNREGKASVDNLPNGNLVVFDNNKIMEVTNFDLASADFGNNNVFTSDRHKNVYKITLKTYFYNRDDLSKADDITESDKFDYEDFGNLDSIFNDDSESAEEVQHRSQEKILSDEVIYPNEVRQKPVRAKEEENNPFGDFG